ncbi:hypothetical protein JVT61DRAFT_5437 [Boletus reticuloceps]|uniref:F-box domain-containing protein n=1 Tax=Boletus reticuloceps TaxID=495285 RepID=A0A8I2YYZ9_9AGAM|nr:hypothetical protein JVT61DRAFT_5437 [Boletus reticuloceps]
MLDLLPVEIIIQVFSHLSHRDLLACSLVCRPFRATVRENASCQYTIEMAVFGMRNGPPSVMGHADRLTILQDSQSAWHTLQWTASKDVRMLQGSLYELYGGVLVQSDHQGGHGLVFRRLPSHYRSIKEHVWSLHLDLNLRDFTLDPAQDLLVLIAQPILRTSAHEARIETSIHIRSLTTGKVHPLVARSPVLVHDVDLRTANLTFMVQIHSDRVAVQFISHGIAPSELVVWNWKTGEVLLSTYGTNLMAFAFLTERLILVGGFGDIGGFGDVTFNLRQPRLFVVDLDSSKGERTDFDEAEYLCAFLYPACYPWVHPLRFLIRSDPCTDWTPHPSVQVPFSIGPGPRLYIVTIWIMQGEEISPIDLFVLSDTLLDHIGTLRKGETRRDFEWSEWGPAGTRMMAQVPHSHVWVCYVFGTRFSSITGGGRENRHRESRMLEVWDFNQLGIRRDIGREGSGAEWSEVEWHVGDTSVLRGKVFLGEVRTRLPYRVFRRKLAAPLEGEPAFTEALCSEDSIILVDAQERHFRILTF